MTKLIRVSLIFHSSIREQKKCTPVRAEPFQHADLGIGKEIEIGIEDDIGIDIVSRDTSRIDTRDVSDAVIEHIHLVARGDNVEPRSAPLGRGARGWVCRRRGTPGPSWASVSSRAHCGFLGGRGRWRHVSG